MAATRASKKDGSSKAAKGSSTFTSSRRKSPPTVASTDKAQRQASVHRGRKRASKQADEVTCNPGPEHETTAKPSLGLGKAAEAMPCNTTAPAKRAVRAHRRPGVVAVPLQSQQMAESHVVAAHHDHQLQPAPTAPYHGAIGPMQQPLPEHAGVQALGTQVISDNGEPPAKRQKGNSPSQASGPACVDQAPAAAPQPAVACELGRACNPSAAEPLPKALDERALLEVRRLLLPGGSALAAREAATASTNGSGSAGQQQPQGRAAQYAELLEAVSSCSLSGQGTAVYISGLPGTGKSFTVSRVVSALAQANGGSSGAHPVTCVTLNCMALEDASQLYSKLLDQVIRAVPGAGKCKAPEAISNVRAAQAALLSILQGTAGRKATGSLAGKNKRPVASTGQAQPLFVVVLDEVDRLLGQRGGEEELVQLFQLPSMPGVRLCLLAVANSLDLTERMMPLLRSRGLQPRHMVFTAYSRPQIVSILNALLAAFPQRVFEDNALDMIAKSISSSSGDLRQVLKACRTAVDVVLEQVRANPELSRLTINMRDAHTALQRITGQANGQAALVGKVKGLPPQQQLTLLALATAVGAKAAADQPSAQKALFTGSKPKFADAVAFRQLNPNAGPDAARISAPLASGQGPAALASSPSINRSCGVRAPSGAGGDTPSASQRGVKGICRPGGGAATPSSHAVGARTPSSILAGDAGLAVLLSDVYAQYVLLCRQLEIPAMSESALRTDAVMGLACDGLVTVSEGRTPAATRLTLKVMVRDVHAALQDNVMFKRLMGSQQQQPQREAAGRPPAGPSQPLMATAQLNAVA